MSRRTAALMRTAELAEGCGEFADEIGYLEDHIPHDGGRIRTTWAFESYVREF